MDAGHVTLHDPVEVPMGTLAHSPSRRRRYGTELWRSAPVQQSLPTMPASGRYRRRLRSCAASERPGRKGPTGGRSEPSLTPAASGVRIHLEPILSLLSIFTMLMTLPQVLTVWLQHDVSGVSIFSWGAYLLAAVVWFFHGLQKRDPAIYLACLGWIILDSAVVIGVVSHL